MEEEVEGVEEDEEETCYIEKLSSKEVQTEEIKYERNFPLNQTFGNRLQIKVS